MTDTPIADMAEQMDKAGTPVNVIVLAIRTAELSSRSATRDATRSDTIPKRSKSALRSARYRTKLKQNQALAKANDVAEPDSQTVTVKRDATRDGVTPPLSSSFLLSEPLQDGNRESKKKRTVVVDGKRGTRLTADTPLDAADRQFALDQGCPDPDAVWAEFVDYWAGIPGQRGTRNGWSGTWRNRVRYLKKNGGFRERSGQARPYSNSGPAQTHGDAIMAGMARHAARRREGQSAAPRDGLRGCDDAAASPDANGRSAGSGGEPSRQLALMPPRNPGE